MKIYDADKSWYNLDKKETGLYHERKSFTVILIAGSSHTGKTLLAQKLLEKYHFPYISIDHLKMGLIRSKNTELTVYDDAGLTEYLWKIVKGIIKTNIENRQNIIIEGCYIPFDWKKDFEEYIKEIRYICLIMTPAYIHNNLAKIQGYENIIENRKNKERLYEEILIKENKDNLEMCRKYKNKYILFDTAYSIDLDEI